MGKIFKWGHKILNHIKEVMLSQNGSLRETVGSLERLRLFPEWQYDCSWEKEEKDSKI
jgi:hypothetical protein